MSSEELPAEPPESPAEQTANIKLSRCATCGHIVEPGSRFCSACGAGLVEDTGVLDAVGEPEAMPGLDASALADVPEDEAVLVVHSGPDTGTRIPLHGVRVTIGRSPEATVFLDDVTVSRRHAELVRSGGNWELTDHGSLNGTYVNRERIEHAALSNGDELQIGKYRFGFYLGGS